jgi:hypothetical protein
LVSIIVIGRLREIELVDSKDPHSVKLYPSIRNEGEHETGMCTEGNFGIRTIMRAQQFTVNIHTS